MTLSFTPLKPGARLADQVAQLLEQAIRDGQLHTGDKLPTEAALVEQMGVSRTVIREAISRLKSLGLVASRQGSGVFVQASGTEPLNFNAEDCASRDAVIQIAEVRRALETEVAELAALRRSPQQLAEIHQAVERLAEAVQQGREGVEEDVDFHRAIARAAGNPFLIDTLDYLSQYLQGATRVTRANEARRLDFSSAVTAEHDAIVRAIETQEPAAARSAAAAHLNNAITRIRQADPGFWQQDGERLARPIMSRSSHSSAK